MIELKLSLGYKDRAEGARWFAATRKNVDYPRSDFGLVDPGTWFAGVGERTVSAFQVKPGEVENRPIGAVRAVHVVYRAAVFDILHHGSNDVARTGSPVFGKAGSGERGPFMGVQLWR